MATALYFTTINGQPVKLNDVFSVHRDPTKRARYEAGIGKSEKDRIVKCGDYYTPMLAAGTAPDGRKYEADRVIFRKANPSNHKCGARCRHAKGGDCECACGGKYHGAGNG